MHMFRKSNFASDLAQIASRHTTALLYSRDSTSMPDAIGILPIPEMCRNNNIYEYLDSIYTCTYISAGLSRGQGPKAALWQTFQSCGQLATETTTTKIVPTENGRWVAIVILILIKFSYFILPVMCGQYMYIYIWYKLKWLKLHIFIYIYISYIVINTKNYFLLTLTTTVWHSLAA